MTLIRAHTSAKAADIIKIITNNQTAGNTHPPKQSNFRGCKVRTGPTPGSQPLGELRNDPGNLRVSITRSQHFYSKDLMYICD